MKISHPVVILLSLLIISCGGGSNESDSGQSPPATGGNQSFDYQVLMMGNSHAAPIPSILDKIFLTAQPSLSVRVVNAPGSMYLLDRLNHRDTLNLLASEQWSHVVLQALKYSTSGTISYPTEGAEFFIDESKANNATPILFPEHPRRGFFWESDYLYQLHTSVASEHPACVAPIGYVWDEFMTKSSLNLYAADGNHASGSGSFLTALIIYQAIVNTDILQLPYIPSVAVSESDQELMKTAVNDILATYPPCIYLNP